MEYTDVRLVEAYRAADTVEAHAIRIALEDAGIHSKIDGEALQGSEYPLGWSTAPRILVAESKVAPAREIIARGACPQVHRLRCGLEIRVAPLSGLRANDGKNGNVPGLWMDIPGGSGLMILAERGGQRAPQSLVSWIVDYCSSETGMISFV